MAQSITPRSYTYSNTRRMHVEEQHLTPLGYTDIPIIQY